MTTTALSHRHADLHGGDHVVQVYDREAVLATCVGRYVEAALLDGEAAVIVATAPHQVLFAQVLTRVGLDLPALEREGRLVRLDAQRTLGGFSRAGRIEPADFRAVVGDVVEPLAQRFGRVSVYGEMVACLWEDGNAAAAVVLEHLWNDLARTTSFSLYCAYPQALLDRSPELVEAMLHTHSEAVLAA